MMQFHLKVPSLLWLMPSGLTPEQLTYMLDEGMWYANPGILFAIKDSRNLREQRQCDAERKNLRKTASLCLKSEVGMAKTGRIPWGYSNSARITVKMRSSDEGPTDT
jgi:hypothetical protein